MNICVTGSNGLIGGAVCNLFLDKGFKVVGIDNNMRSSFFGVDADTSLKNETFKENKNYKYINLDIRLQDEIEILIKKGQFDAVVHCAAQPSHDKAKEIPILDFEVNVVGTLNILEAIRKNSPQTAFIFTSTNKVYGDNPNKLIEYQETETRFSPKDKKFEGGISELMSIDQTVHSLFGSSKLAADIYVQEYGKYFGIKSMGLRLGCVTGKSHASVKLHGFLSFLIKSLIHEGKYEIIGYKGKQVRDQIDASDVAGAIFEMIKKPHPGEIYNMGGGVKNNSSVLELINQIEKITGEKYKISYNDNARKGDHIWYISDISKFKRDYPDWKLRKSLKDMVREIVEYEQSLH